MKTPVGDTPELEAKALDDTRARPERFDDTKLFGRSSWWEFCKWDRVDTVGFIICSSLSLAIVGLFLLLLHLAAAG